MQVMPVKLELQARHVFAYGSKGLYYPHLLRSCEQVQPTHGRMVPAPNRPTDCALSTCSRIALQLHASSDG